MSYFSTTENGYNSIGVVVILEIMNLFTLSDFGFEFSLRLCAEAVEDI